MRFSGPKRWAIGGRAALAAIAGLSSLVTLGATLVLGSGPGGAATSKKDAGVVVKIADVEGGDAYYFALKDGTLDKYLSKYGATAQIVSSFPAEAPALQAMAAGAADFTEGSITATIGGLAGSSDVQVFAYEPDGATKLTEEAVVVKKGSGITKPQDLEGKTVAVNQAGTGEYVLDKVLDYYHIPEDSVKKVYLSPPQGATAFASGSVDAWSTFATYIDLAEQQDNATVLVGGNQVGAKNDTVDVVNTSFARAHPELVEAVYQALAAESAKIKAHPQAYDQYLQTTDHLTASLITYSNAVLQDLQPVGQPQLKRFQGVADFFHQWGAIPTAVDMTGHVFDVTNGKTY